MARVENVGVVTPDEARLSVPRDHAELPGRAADTDLAFVDILGSESPGGRSYWRLVDLYSIDERPFIALLTWTGGGGPIRLSCSRATRVCIHASAVKIRGANLATEVNRVACQVSDILTPIPTQNVYEIGFLGAGVALGSAVDHPVPPYALRVRVDCATIPGLAATDVEVYDGNDNIVSKYAANTQPSDGVSVASAKFVRVTPPPGVRCRISFLLSV